MNKKTVFLTTLVCLIPLVLGIVLYPSLPDLMPIHWNFSGEVDSYSSKFMGAIGLPLLFVGLNLMMPAIIRLDPKYKEMNSKLLSLTLWIMPCVGLFASISIFSTVYGYSLNVGKVVEVLLGLLFVVIGNFLPKAKQSYTVGIRVPWTLDNENNWNKTHRLGGFVFVVGGLLVIISALLNLDSRIIASIFLAVALIPCIYSYLLYKKGN